MLSPFLKKTGRIPEPLARSVSNAAEAGTAAAAQDNDDQNNPNTTVIVVSPKHRICSFLRALYWLSVARCNCLRKPVVGYA
jgi:hypothetical protein